MKTDTRVGEVTLTQGTELPSRNVYDITGQRVLRVDPDGSKTIYLGSTELRWTPGSAAVDVARTYGSGVRRDFDGTVQYTVANHQGTAGTTVSAATGVVTYNHFLPYGGLRAGSLVDDKGFLGQTHDDASSLVYLNNRHYDPSVGVFISVDPLVTATMEPYIYGRANPVRFSDPDGLCGRDDPREGASACNSQDNSGKPCGLICQRNNPGHPANEAPSMEWVHGALDAVGMLPVVGAPADAVNAGIYLFDGDVKNAGISGLGLLPGGQSATGARVAGRHGDEVLDAVGGVGRYGDEAVDAARVCGLRSFSGGTEVLMADGSTKPISEIQVGDVVLAEDPETGERGAREVTHLWVHRDDLVDLVTDAGSITTTEDHPFWNNSDREWQWATDIDHGEHLLTDDGGLVEVNGLDSATAANGWAYNLTVAEIHTYFVAVGETAVLVHNTNCSYVNPGHHVPGSGRYVPGKAVLPPNAAELFESSIDVGGTRWTKLGTGRKAEYHRFFDDGNGNWHTGQALLSASTAAASAYRSPWIGFRSQSEGVRRCR